MKKKNPEMSMTNITVTGTTGMFNSSNPRAQSSRNINLSDI